MADDKNLHWGRRVAWFACGASALLLLPVLKNAELWGALPRQAKLALLIALGAFGASCLLSLLMDRGVSWSIAQRALLRSFAILGVFLFAAAAVSITLPRYLLLPLAGLLALIVPLSASPVARRGWALGALAVLVGGMAVYALGHIDSIAEVERKTHDAYFSTAFYPLHATIREGWIREPATRGGGLHPLDDRVLLGTGDGHLYVIDVPEDRNGFKVEELPTVVPLNREEFAAAFGGSSRSPKYSRDWKETGPPKVQTWRFRVADVIAAVDGDRVRIFASHHYWQAQGECFVVRVSELSASLRDLSQSVAKAQWSTIYDSSPCVPLKGPERKRGKNPFKGEEVGGRLLLLEPGKLLLTLGDQGFSGIESTQTFSQDPAADYGKTLLIDLATRERRIFTSGHRNPQGLYRAADGRLWLTEHGPQGGDELNLLQENANFGWPEVTYGTDYGSTAWPMNKSQGRHPGYQQPTLTWVPSIGVSEVMEIGGNQFPIWEHDLLVGSLSTRSLYRLAVVENRVVLQEPIPLDKRVRDLLQLPDGRILVWSDDATITTIERSSALDGATLFAHSCLGCHSVQDGMSHRLGPDLFGIVGRKPGSAPEYDEYSPAMQAQSGVWDAERLDRFLQQPQTSVPGNTMAFPGVPDAAHRKAIIEYLSRSKRD